MNCFPFRFRAGSPDHRRGQGRPRSAAASVCIARILAWVLSLMGLGWTTPASAQATVSGAGYETFVLVQSRNLFDPDRRPPRPQNTVRETTSPARSESLVLTGTLVQPTQALAFFGGSQPEHRQVRSIEEEVAGYTLVSITTAHVELEREGERLRLPVGQGLRREGEGPWEITTDVRRPDAASSSTPRAETQGGGASEDAPSDVMKRLMQRRQQEVSR
jgi:hypothetical protein